MTIVSCSRGLTPGTVGIPGVCFRSIPIPGVAIPGVPQNIFSPFPGFVTIPGVRQGLNSVPGVAVPGVPEGTEETMDVRWGEM